MYQAAITGLGVSFRLCDATFSSYQGKTTGYLSNSSHHLSRRFVAKPGFYGTNKAGIDDVITESNKKKGRYGSQAHKSIWFVKLQNW